jgi:hypothetical protein
MGLGTETQHLSTSAASGGRLATAFSSACRRSSRSASAVAPRRRSSVARSSAPARVGSPAATPSAESASSSRSPSSAIVAIRPARRRVPPSGGGGRGGAVPGSASAPRPASRQVREREAQSARRFARRELLGVRDAPRSNGSAPAASPPIARAILVGSASGSCSREARRREEGERASGGATGVAFEERPPAICAAASPSAAVGWAAAPAPGRRRARSATEQGTESIEHRGGDLRVGFDLLTGP